MENGLHIGVGRIEGVFVDIQIVLIVLADPLLVKDAQHLVKPVVNLSVQAGYLYDNAVMVKTIDKLIWNTTRDELVVVIVRLVTDIDDGVFYLANGMSQQVDSHHRQGMTVNAVGYNILRILVVNT